MVVADFIRHCLAPLQNHNRPAWAYSGVDDIGHTQSGPESVLSLAAVLRMVKKILVEDCGPLQLPAGVLTLAEDPKQEVIMRYLPSFNAFGVRMGPSETVQIGKKWLTDPRAQYLIVEEKKEHSPSPPPPCIPKGPWGGTRALSPL